jgi:predicted TIM-barrel fold metal-dependent hydrolase
MIEDLREAGVQVMINIGMTTDVPIERVQELHGYSARSIQNNPDVFLRQWIMIDPSDETLAGFERCLTELKMGMVGFTVNGASTNRAQTGVACRPFYKLCLKYNAPIQYNSGTLGLALNTQVEIAGS